MNKCLFCYKDIEDKKDFHPICSKKIFGKTNPPELPYTESQMLELADKVIKSQITVTGVQPKLSLDIVNTQEKDIPQRFTIVGLWGEYILKPPTKQYSNLPEIEDLTMHLAQISKISTVPHSLIRMKDGNLAYITKRIDRNKSIKIHMEDMCQLSEKLTENKYNGSYEQIGKIISKNSMNPILDIINFFELVVFCFLTGNADMHLKNFSLIKFSKDSYILSPAYDLVASALVVLNDKEDLALTLNAKKNKIKKKDFIIFAQSFKIDDKVIENTFKRFNKLIPQWLNFIDQSFIPTDMKENFKNLLIEKANRIELI